MSQAAFLYSDAYLGYRFSRSHPLQQVRLQMNCRLLEAYGLFDRSEIELVAPTPAGEADLRLVHTAEYIAALQDLSRGVSVDDPVRHGFGAGDNPAFPGMYDATLLYLGGTKEAVRRIVSGENKYAFNNSGGLHHAMPDRAAGFCLANDCGIAAKQLTEAGCRVVYIDIDAHHGDGVQHIFYSDPSVLTISLHETPVTLFPRLTGYVDEIGDGAGTGFNVNVPMLAGSSDEEYAFAFREIVNPTIKAFKPTVVVLQVGADGHFDDPLAHLALTSRGWLHMVQEVIGYGLPIVALGGGGYNLKTVARLWTLLQAQLAGVQLPDEVPAAYADQYGITNLHDTTAPSVGASIKADCERNVRSVAQTLQASVFPVLTA